MVVTHDESDTDLLHDIMQAQTAAWDAEGN
jgi:hypothetical protein